MQERVILPFGNFMSSIEVDPGGDRGIRPTDSS
jgi:hypothetical protein